MNIFNRRPRAAAARLAVWVASASLLAVAQDQKAVAPPDSTSVASSLYVKVQLGNSVKIAALKPGDVVEGKLARDVYSAGRELYPTGSNVRLTVQGLERRRRIANDNWPWIVKLFTPRHQNYPTFQDAVVSVANDKDSSLRVSLISISRKKEVHAQASKAKSEPAVVKGNSSIDLGAPAAVNIPGTNTPVGPVMVLEGQATGNSETSPIDSGIGHDQPSFAAPLTVPAGTKCKILLLTTVSASKSKSGDVVQGRLLEPVLLDSRVVLPAGSLFEGKVLKTVPPRWLSRSGSMYFAFTELNILDGNRVPIAASITGAEIDQKSHTRIDAEGRIRADKPGAAWMLVNVGATYGIGKVADDATQLVVEALISTATDASTAGLARIVSTSVSGIFMVSRHGRDVVLPKFTEMNIMLDRPLNLPSRPESSAVTTSEIGD